MGGDPIKEHALQLANQALGQGASADEVVARAEIYERYLKGEAKAGETSLPIPPGGSVEDLDALHG